MNLLKSIFILVFIFSFTSISFAEPRCYGIHRSSEINQNYIDLLKDAYGVKPCVVLIFLDLSVKFDPKILDNIWDEGSIPMVTVQPFNMPLADIVSGKFDDNINYFAAQIKNFGRPLFIRFAHEMNGNWYPWSGAKNDNNPEMYIKAYRYFADKVNAVVGSVKPMWVWSVNAKSVPDDDWNDAEKYYPGDNFVDLIGVDGYNFGDSRNFSEIRWNELFGWLKNKILKKYQNFEQIFSAQVFELKKNHPQRPVIISEIAAPSGEKRVLWLKNFFEDLNTKYNFIPIFIWFDISKEMPWRLQGDKSSESIFKSNITKDWNSGREDILKFLQK